MLYFESMGYRPPVKPYYLNVLNSLYCRAVRINRQCGNKPFLFAFRKNVGNSSPVAGRIEMLKPSIAPSSANVRLHLYRLSDLLISCTRRWSRLILAVRDFDFNFAALRSHKRFSGQLLLVLRELREELSVECGRRVGEDLAAPLGALVNTILHLEQRGHFELARGPVNKIGEFALSVAQDLCTVFRGQSKLGSKAFGRVGVAKLAVAGKT